MQNTMMQFPMGGMPNNMMNNPFMMGGGYGGMPMNGMDMFGGPQSNFGIGMGNMGMMNNGMMGGNMYNGPGQFSNQQKNAFVETTSNQEDNAYFRQPVNPHRHQGRQRRARPSDYRELWLLFEIMCGDRCTISSYLVHRALELGGVFLSF